MKALLVEQPGNFRVGDFPQPVALAGHVLVRVMSATICHTDLQIIRGYRRSFVTYPLIPGHEFCGLVERCGEDVEKVVPGDHVACEGVVWCGDCDRCREGKTSTCQNFQELGTTKNGGFAQFVAVPEKLVHKTAMDDFDSVAMTEPTANALHAVEKTGIGAGDDVAIIGPGPIGLLALQIARTFHPRSLIIVGTREERLAAALRLGASHSVDVRRADAASTIMDITSGRGANRIIQCAPSKAAMDLALAIGKHDCTITVEAIADDDCSFCVPMNEMIMRPLRIVGANGYTTQHFAEALHLIASGLIDVRSIITHRFTLDQIGEAFRLIEERCDGIIKGCIHPQGVTS